MWNSIEALESRVLLSGDGFGIPADADRDGDVDLDDFNQFASNFGLAGGATDMQGDGDGDGDVDFDDFNMLAANFGARYTPPGDIDGDRFVDLDDFDVLASEFGNTVDESIESVDLDNSGEIDIGDFNVLASNFGYPLLSPEARQRAEERASQVIAFIPVGGTSDDPATYGVNPIHFDEGGWVEFIQKKVVPHLEFGVRRIHLHHPFGSTPGEVNDFDQRLEAKALGLNWLTDGFIHQWQRVIRGDYTGGEPVRVLAYIGSGLYDQDMVDLYEAGDIAGWNQRAWASVQPLIDAGMDIGLDSSIGAFPDHPLSTFAVNLRDLTGRRVYAESWPWVGANVGHWGEMSVLVDERSYYRSQNRMWSVPREEIGGEIVRLFSHRLPEDNSLSWDDIDGMVDALAEAIALGDSISFDTKRLSSEQVTLEDILALAELKAMGLQTN